LLRAYHDVVEHAGSGAGSPEGWAALVARAVALAI
jgi:hypothetical protein